MPNSTAIRTSITRIRNGVNGIISSIGTPDSSTISPTSWTVLIVAIVLASSALVLLLLVLRKRLRVRRRRRSRDPRRRLVGAWQEGLDVLVEAGLPDLSTLTSAEVADRTQLQFGDETAVQARYLGDSANAAIFSPASRIGDTDADAAWRAEAVLRRAVRGRLSWPQRVSAQLRYHRPQVRPRPRQRAH